MAVCLLCGVGCQSGPNDATGTISDEHAALERERQRVMAELAVLERELRVGENAPFSDDQPPTVTIVRDKPPAPARRVRTAWFYDLNTGELFTASADAIPPIDAPSGPLRVGGGPAGVRAYVFTCGECDDASRFVGYIETYSPAASRQMRAARQRANSERRSIDFLLLDREARKGRLVKRVNDTQWVPAYGELGARIVTSVVRRCAQGQQVKPCLPPASSETGVGKPTE